jgi:hypothetical protein
MMDKLFLDTNVVMDLSVNENHIIWLLLRLQPFRTRNGKDFKMSDIPFLSPQEYLNSLNK